jgi:lipopolysaccharide export system permease protein
MVHQLSSVNPLLLLQSAKIARLQDAYVQMDPVRNGELAQNLIIALNNPSCERLNLCLAKQIEMEKENLKVKHISIISSTPSKEGFDHLIIENQASMSASAPEFAKLLRKSGWKMANDHLKFSLLRVKAKRLRDQVKEGNSNIRVLNKCHSEMVRRFSLGLAAFSFTLLGLAYGIEISRQHKKRGIAFVLALTTICLIAFCMGKALSHVFWLATFLFLFPHVCLILASCWAINRVNRGIE